MLLALLLAAAPPLAPSPEFAERLRELELRRAPLAVRRSRAFALQLSGGIGYGLAAVTLAWGIADLALVESHKAAGPLGGSTYHSPVPPWVMLVTGTVLTVVSVGLHVGGRQLALSAEDDEQDLDDAERRVRKAFETSDEP